MTLLLERLLGHIQCSLDWRVHCDESVINADDAEPEFAARRLYNVLPPWDGD